MKVSGKGIAIIFLFLVGIPVVIDLIISLLVMKNNTANLGISKLLLSGYLFFLPRYIWYVILVFTIMYLIKTVKSYSKQKR